MKMKKDPYLEVPRFTVHGRSGSYTGFNSVNLQEMYVVEKRPVVRSQIARGWGKPVIVMLPNGDLLASQYKNLRLERNPKYPEADEEAALCRSVDGGLSWSSPRLLGIPGRLVQLSALKDGTLILAVELGGLFRCSDDGRTWDPCEVKWEEFAEENATCIFGESTGALKMPDGTLVCPCYTDAGPGTTKSFIIRSRDGGKTWRDASCTAATAEVSYILLPDGTLLGFARVGNYGAGEGGSSLAVIESADMGRSWTQPRGIGLGMAQIPGFPVYLKDGRLLLIYGNRQFPFGAQVIASRDGGKTWDTNHPIILAWFSWDNYCGHPRSLLMPDGSILTGYYSRAFKTSDKDATSDIVSHAVRWRVPDNWPPQS